MKFLWNLFWRERELKRQIFHMSFGLVYATGYFFGLINVPVSIMLLICLIGASVYLKKRRRVIDKIVLLLERREHLFDFPLQGPIFFIFGVTLTIAIFDLYSATGGIIILAITDSLGTLYGKYMGRVKIPWNKKKHLEGPILGGLAAGFACMAFFPVLPAFLAAFIGAFVDTFNLRFKYVVLDDNLLIPLVGAGVLALF